MNTTITKPRVSETPELDVPTILNGLQTGAVIIDESGWAWQKMPSGDWAGVGAVGDASPESIRWVFQP